MRILIHRFLFFSFFILFQFASVCTYSQVKTKVKTVKKLPVMYAYPVDSVTYINGATIEKPWIVYSDRNNNVTYTDSKIRTVFKTTRFLESFYVINETSDLVEIVKYAPDMLESITKVKAPSKVQYYGWIQKTKVLLSPKSYVESVDKRPMKWVTMLNGKNVIDKIKNYTEGEYIKLFDGPELQTSLNNSIYFNELVYVYKVYGTKVLIGKQTHFTPENSTDIILGWVPSNFVQSWGQRLCIEPLNDQGSQSSIPMIYTNKESALTGNSSATRFTIDHPSCEKEFNWKKYPVFKIEEVNKNKIPYKLFYTGAITSTFDKSESFIYNVNGAKLNYSKLCDISKSNKNVNVVIAINAGSDTREYLYALTNTVQELSAFFNTDKNNWHYHFAAVDCSVNSSRTEFTDQYSSIVPTLIGIAQKSVEGKNNFVNNGIGNGLTNAAALFKGHEDELNIILVISSKADSDTRLLRESLYSDLGSKNVRLVFIQPYCGTSTNYTDLIEQGGSIIENTANKIATFKRNKLATNLYTSDRFKYKMLALDENNVSYLDFPTNASTQGFIVFPTMNNKIEGKSVSIALDSLLLQIDKDNKMMITSLQHVFNSSSSFNNSVNKTFVEYYKTQDALPDDLGLALNNIDYNYFIPGYTACPETMKPFKVSLLLSIEEYEDIYNMFKGLKLDQLNDQYDLKGRTLVYQEFSRLLTNYNKEHYISIPIYNLSFSDYFYKLFGFYSDNELLNKYKVYDLNSPNIINKDDLKTIIDHLNKRINSFYKLRGDTRTMFVSNGNQYYWVSEDYLP